MLERDDAPVLARELQFLQRRGAVPRGEVLLATREHTADRAAEPHGEERGDDPVLVRAELRAEATAHVLADHANLRRLQLERVFQHVAHAEHRLRRFPHREPIAVPRCDRAVRLEGVVHLRGRSVGDVDGHVGVLEGFPEVAALVLAGIVDVAIGIDPGRLRSDRLFQIDDMREDLVVDLDECDGLLRDLGIVRSDGGHFVAHELHLVAEERLLAAELDLRRVEPVQHRAHTR